VIAQTVAGTGASFKTKPKKQANAVKSGRKSDETLVGCAFSSLA
jgi:hypothetical protein